MPYRNFCAGSVVMTLALLSLGAARTRAQNTAKRDTKTAQSAYHGEIMDSDCAQMGSHQMTMGSEKLATPELCTMYCMRYKQAPGKYVLYDSATKTIYNLDDQNQAQFFGGMKVKVTGSYDRASKTIHVRDITSASES